MKKVAYRYGMPFSLISNRALQSLWYNVSMSKKTNNKIEEMNKTYNKDFYRKKEKKCKICKSKIENKRRSYCIDCYNKSDIQKEKRRTIKGFIDLTYSNQLSRSKLKGLGEPKYSKEELHNFLVNNNVFKKLFKDWKKSNYKKALSPSIDRLDDYKGYSFDNIRVVTWRENQLRGFSDKINGLNRKTLKEVYQYDLERNFIKKYYSTMQAERETGVSHQCISFCARGVTKKSGGFIWSYIPLSSCG